MTKSLAFACIASLLAFDDLSAVSTTDVTVVETAGLRRFGYPVTAKLLPAPGTSKTTRFRLLDGKDVVPAQFRLGDAGVCWLDFKVNLLPYASRTYTVQYGDDVEAGPEPARGLTLRETRDAFVIANAPYLDWTVPKDLGGIVRSVKTQSNEYFRPDSLGLVFEDRDGQAFQVGGAGAGGPVAIKVVRSGPFAIALRLEGRPASQSLSGVEYAVDVEFVGSKSWVRVACNIDDPEGRIRSLGTHLGTNVTTAPTIVDFGATSMVYMMLKHGEQAELFAGRAPSRAANGVEDEHLWRILHSTPDEIAPFAVGPRVTASSATAEGWAHVMDQKICIAAAVEDFARDARDRIAVSGSGDLFIRRDYAVDGAAPERGNKELRYGVHVIPVPLQISATTSPQSMQAPLDVRVSAR